MHFGNLQDLVKTQVEWITKGFHFLYKENISCSIQKDSVSPFWNSDNINCVKIQCKLLKPLRSQSKAKILYALIVLCYLTGTDLLIAFASPVCGWVDEALVHGASSNWTQALMDDDRSVLGDTWLPGSTLGCSAASSASSSSEQKRSWNPPFALWFSSEDVSEELKHFTGGASVLPKIEVT